MHRTVLVTLISVFIPAIVFAQATGGAPSAGGSAGAGGLGGTTPPGVSNIGSGVGGEPPASGSGAAGAPRVAPAPRPPLGSPDVGNIGAPAAIDPAANAAVGRRESLTDDNSTRAGTIDAGTTVVYPNVAAQPGRAAGRLGSDWRYVYQGGRHWYWMPNNSWNLWSGAAWEPYPGGMLNRTAQSQMQMRGYRRQAVANYPRAYDERGMQGPIAPTNPRAPRDGTRTLGPRRYSATVGPQQGLPPQDTTPLPKSPAQVHGQDVLETVPDASGVTVP